MKKVKDIIKIIEEFAPVNLKEDFDNVGLMIGDREKEVKKVLIALDYTLEEIDEAIENDVDLIITHHPILFIRPNSITDDTTLGKKIIKLIQNNISVYSAHTNLDSAHGGINDALVDMLGFKSSGVIEINKNARDNNDGLGRIVNLEQETDIYDLIGDIKKKLNIESLRLIKGKDTAKKLAIINGDGYDYLKVSYNMGVDCIITGDTKYSKCLDYKELKVNIIDIGHFASEWMPFVNVIRRLESKFSDVEIIISKKSSDIYLTV